MAGCAISPTSDAFASGVLSYLDCQAQTLGQQGYLALAAPGSTASLLLAALLTIFIAVLGYRMLFGEAPGVRDGVLAIAKVGIVLAVATSWPAYRTVIYDVVLHGPADLVAEIGRPAGLPGTEGGLATRIDGVDRSLRLLAIYGVGTPTREQVGAANGIAPPLFANFDVFALGASRLVFLVGTLGGFALVRLSAGFLLATGPIFIGFLLFDATRRLAEGWIKGLVAVAIGSAALSVALAIELGLLEPWFGDLLIRRAGGVAMPGVPTAMLVTAMVFALAAAGLLVAMARLAMALRLPDPAMRWVENVRGHEAPERMHTVSTARDRRTHIERRSRAVAIADSIAASQRRDAGPGASAVSRAYLIAGGAKAAERTASVAPAAAPLGQSFRRTRPRLSGHAAARDRGA